jgi:D-threo-aldose 1-dehydrogenase
LAPGADAGGPPAFDFGYDATMRIVEGSLRRLGLDRVDILHIHDPDDYERAALDGAFKALQRLKEQGVCRAIGSGMNQAEMLARFALAADFDCFLLAGRYTLLEQEALDSFLPLCDANGVGVILGGPFNSGILATGSVPEARYNYAPAPKEILTRVWRLDAVCRAHGVRLIEAALQFVLGHPAVKSVIPGANSPDQVRSNVALLETAIPAALWADLKTERLLRADAPVAWGRA